RSPSSMPTASRWRRSKRFVHPATRKARHTWRAFRLSTRKRDPRGDPMPVTMRTILLAGAVLALPACTFVKMAPGAQQVKVLAAAPVGCERRADVAVSVTHKVGFYERSD